MGKKTSCEIILGTYEEYILGFKYNKKAEEAEQTFAVHSHAGSIRCVAQSGDLLASGGSDDRIVVYNLHTRKEHCLLNHHNGTVNCLAFTTANTHLISGGQDGMLAIVRVGNWQLEKVWENAHKGGVLDIAVHKSGKLALTLGADATLRTWNLVKGRQAYVINLNSKSKEPRSLHGIKWHNDGVRFVLVGSKYTDVWSIETGGVLKSIEHQQKISSCIWQNDKLIVGYDNGHLGIVDVDDVDEDNRINVHEAHDNRVKCLALYGNKLITGSSSGEIKVFSSKFKQLCVANAGCRFTCMCVSLDTSTETHEKSVELENIDTESIEVDDEEVVIKQKRKKKDKKVETLPVVKKQAKVVEDSVSTGSTANLKKKTKRAKKSF